MLILDKLWNGEIEASGRNIRDREAYSKFVQEAAEAEKKLLAVLPPEGRELLDTFCARRNVLSSFLEQDAFVLGFRIAGLMLLDILCGNQ